MPLAKIAQTCECSIYLVRKELGDQGVRKKRTKTGKTGHDSAPGRARNSRGQAKKRVKKGKRAVKKGVAAKEEAKSTAVKLRIAKKKAFLEALLRIGLVKNACVAVGVSASTVYRWMEEDPEGFGKEVERVNAIINLDIDDSFIKRGVHGVKSQMFYKGKPVMTPKLNENDEEVKGEDGEPVMVAVFETVYSDTCLLAAAKSRMPDKYADRSKAQVDNTHSMGNETRKAIADMTAPEREARLTELFNNIKKVGG